MDTTIDTKQYLVIQDHRSEFPSLSHLKNELLLLWVGKMKAQKAGTTGSSVNHRLATDNYLF